MLHRRCAALVVGAALALGTLGSGVAAAAPDPVPSMTRCPRTVPNIWMCIVVQSTSGTMKINNTTVNLADSIRIDGGATYDSTGPNFVPPATGSALTSKPIDVPGGLLGIPLPFGLDTVKATTRLVGSVKFDFVTGNLSMPVVIDLDNPLLGPDCRIGASWLPIKLNLITGTTAPPPPNTPISGQYGTGMSIDASNLEIQDHLTVDNAFSVPIALDCGYLTGILVTTAVNLKLGLPSPAGKNTAIVRSNVFLHDPLVP